MSGDDRPRGSFANMPRKYRYSTLGHLESGSDADQFRLLCEKWVSWRISEADHKWLDLTDCAFLGEGGHEIVAFTFDRHLHLSRLSGTSTLPIWLAVGPHWSDGWHDLQGLPNDSVPLVGLVRGISEPAAFVEPLRVLMIASCTNGQLVYDEMMRRIVPHTEVNECCHPFGNPRFRRLHLPLSTVVAAGEASLALPCPSIEPIAPMENGATVSLTFDDFEEIARSLPRFVTTDCPVWGVGESVVYSYTFRSFSDAAALTGEDDYPVKIGYTSIPPEHGDPVRAAAARVSCQVVCPEPADLLGAFRCANGRATEGAIHRQLKDQKIRCPAAEWFMTNKEEVQGLMQALIAV